MRNAQEPNIHLHYFGEPGPPKTPLRKLALISAGMGLSPFLSVAGVLSVSSYLSPLYESHSFGSKWQKQKLSLLYSRKGMYWFISLEGQRGGSGKARTIENRAYATWTRDSPSQEPSLHSLFTFTWLCLASRTNISHWATNPRITFCQGWPPQQKERIYFQCLCLLLEFGFWWALLESHDHLL